jgi:hypothetical protein
VLDGGSSGRGRLPLVNAQRLNNGRLGWSGGVEEQVVCAMAGHGGRVQGGVRQSGKRAKQRARIELLRLARIQEKKREEEREKKREKVQKSRRRGRQV